MTSPIFDTLTAEREATPLFESLSEGPGGTMWSFETATAPSTRGTAAAVTAVATWPLRAVRC